MEFRLDFARGFVYNGGTSIVTEQELIPTQSGQFIAPDNWGISKQDDVPIDEYDRIKGKNTLMAAAVRVFF